jgi:putative transposase
MTEERLSFAELLQKAGDGDFLRAVAEAVLQLLMEAGACPRLDRVVEGLIGAARHERSAERLNYRNGYRERTLDTRSAACSFVSPSSVRAPTSRRSWSPGR